MSTGSRIKERRKQLGMTADQLAEKIGVARSTMFRYENGDIEKVPLDYLGALSSALCTTPQYLMGWSDDPLAQDTNAPSKPDDLTPFEREIITKLRQLSEDQQQAFLAYLITLLHMQTP